MEKDKKYEKKRKNEKKNNKKWNKHNMKQLQFQSKIHKYSFYLCLRTSMS